MVFNPKFILILGSYDPNTKKMIYSLKNRISQRFYMESVFGLVLDNLEVYMSDSVIQVLTELHETTLTIMEFRGNELMDIVEKTKVDVEHTDNVVYNHIRKKYGTSRLRKLPVIHKLQNLMGMSSLICVIREEEETRGGEYLELVHAMSKDFDEKILFLAKEDIKLSGMLMEYLDAYNVVIRKYSSESQFLDITTRYIQYQVVSRGNL